MFAKVIGKIEGVFPSPSGKVFRIKLTSESNGKSYNKIITCWEEEYKENINLLEVGNKVIIECLLRDRYITSSVAAYIEGHEKEGQWFEYHTLEPYLISVKYYQQNISAPKPQTLNQPPRAPKAPKAPNPFKKDIQNSDITLEDIFNNED